jgi:RNA polymerase sigma-70 factor, ECF subfamily
LASDRWRSLTAASRRDRLTMLQAAGTVACMPGPDTAPFVDRPDGDLAREVASSPPGQAAAAEGELYRRFARRIRLFGVKHLHDGMAADDLAQQVMLIAIERLRAGEIRNPDEIGSFILSTSRMVATGLRRTERRREHLHRRVEAGEPVDMPRDERLFDADRVKPCLGSMRERDRTILLLTYYVERSATEIAVAMGMTAGAVRVARHRAVAAMRDCLEARRPG